MLQPRRLATRAAAGFIASRLGERPGQTVGYRTRLESRIGPDTRIEFVTEGILTRLIQSDPALPGYAAIIFDEFHERSLQADLGLALALEVQEALRPDCRLIIMSATLESDRLQQLLGGAPVLEGHGITHPVEVHYQPPTRNRPLIEHVAGTVKKTLVSEPGSILVFLPGLGEIRAVARRLENQLPGDVDLHLLHGSLSADRQDQAISPAPVGRRKVVLSSAVAETSLTIEGIRVVIDSGLSRMTRFDPGTGMSGLVTVPVSAASARQRQGRAGRLEPGICIRLWPEQQRLEAADSPEIMDADLAPLLLELAAWGSGDPDQLRWLDRPPEAHIAQARELLVMLDAVDGRGQLTAQGRAMHRLGIHPRLAHMVVRGREMALGRTAADLAALLSEHSRRGDEAGADLAHRLLLFRQAADRGGRALAGWRQVAKLSRRLYQGSDRSGLSGESAVGALLALGWPDRIGQQRPGQRSRYLLSNGRGAWLPEEEGLAGSPWLVAVALDDREREARIFSGAAITRDDIEQTLAERIVDSEQVKWDASRGAPVMIRQRCLGELVLDESRQRLNDPQKTAQALLAQVRQHGLELLEPRPAERQFLARVALLHRLWPERWPDADETLLLESLDDWLLPFMTGIGDLTALKAMDKLPALKHRIDPALWHRLDELAPQRLEVPAGRQVRLDYTAEGGPVLAVKLQAVFGWSDSPRIADGRVAVTLHLLSPADRPLAITADLASFWQQAYPEVRKQMRGRYPRHPWPEDPTTATATFGTRKTCQGRTTG